MPQPSDFRATFERRWLWWEARIETRDADSAWKIVVPFDEYDSPLRALTLYGAKLKAGLWIEHHCKPPESEPVVIGGDDLLEHVDSDRYSYMHP